MSNRLSELAEKLNEHLLAVDEIKAEMLEILTAEGPKARPANVTKKTPAARKPAAPKSEGSSSTESKDDGASDRGPSLKEIVLGILEKGPAELKSIVGEVTKMIKAGEYRSKAKKVTPVVSQALFQLKQEKLVAVEKTTDQDGKFHNLYSKSAA